MDGCMNWSTDGLMVGCVDGWTDIVDGWMTRFLHLIHCFWPVGTDVKELPGNSGGSVKGKHKKKQKSLPTSQLESKVKIPKVAGLVDGLPSGRKKASHNKPQSHAESSAQNKVVCRFMRVCAWLDACGDGGLEEIACRWRDGSVSWWVFDRRLDGLLFSYTWIEDQYTGD